MFRNLWTNSLYCNPKTKSRLFLWRWPRNRYCKTIDHDYLWPDLCLFIAPWSDRSSLLTIACNRTLQKSRQVILFSISDIYHCFVIGTAINLQYCCNYKHISSQVIKFVCKCEHNNVNLQPIPNLAWNILPIDESKIAM